MTSHPLHASGLTTQPVCIHQTRVSASPTVRDAIRCRCTQASTLFLLWCLRFLSCRRFRCFDCFGCLGSCFGSCFGCCFGGWTGRVLLLGLLVSFEHSIKVRVLQNTHIRDITIEAGNRETTGSEKGRNRHFQKKYGKREIMSVQGARCETYTEEARCVSHRRTSRDVNNQTIHSQKAAYIACQTIHSVRQKVTKSH